MHQLMILTAKLLLALLVLLLVLPLNIGADSSPYTTEPLRVLVLGNSIAYHPPEPELDWYGHWGMAASDESKDFVHVLTELLTEEWRVPPVLLHANISEFEYEFQTYDFEQLRVYRDFNADIIVIRIGDNILSEDGYAQAYRALIEFVRSSNRQILVCSSAWFQRPTVDQIQKLECLKKGGRYADISRLISRYRNLAASERTYADMRVGYHPGDRGMSRIATILFENMTIREQFFPMIFRP